jgi:chromosome segregation ATPase
VLALCCVGLLVWALSLRSDLDTTQQQVGSLQAQIDKQAQTGDVVQSSLQAAYDQIVKQLGTAKGDLNALTQDIDTAKQAVADADERA